VADRGEDVSHFFTNRGKMMRPIRRVNLDFTAPMLEEPAEAAAEINVSRQEPAQPRLALGAWKASRLWRTS
jgi:hypothetical protein